MDKFISDLEKLETGANSKAHVEGGDGFYYFFLPCKKVGSNNGYAFSDSVFAGLWACKRLEVATRDDMKGKYENAVIGLTDFLTNSP